VELKKNILFFKLTESLGLPYCSVLLAASFLLLPDTRTHETGKMKNERSFSAHLVYACTFPEQYKGETGMATDLKHSTMIDYLVIYGLYH